MKSGDYPNAGNHWYQQPQDNAVHPPHGQEWNNPDPTHPQEWNHPQQPDDNHGYGGASNNMYDQAEGQAPDPMYNQQPYYASQQSNDSMAAPGESMQGNVDQAGAPNNWESAAEGSWNNPNAANQLPHNAPLDNSSGSLGNGEQNAAPAPINQDDDEEGSGYLGFFHNDDNESDFAESDRTESVEDPTNHHEPPPASLHSGSDNSQSFQGNNEPFHQNVPSSQPGGVVQHGPAPAAQYPYSQPYQPEGQEFVPPGNNNDNASATMQQPFQDVDMPQEDDYRQNQSYPPPPAPTQSNTRPNVDLELHSGADAGPPISEQSSLSSSLPTSDPSGSSASTSRSNSLLGEGAVGSTASSLVGVSSLSSHDNAPVVAPILEHAGNHSPAVEGSVPHFGQAEQPVMSQPPIGQQHQPMLYNPQGFAPSPADVSQQNSANSEVSSSASAPSAGDSDPSRTDGNGSLLAESEQEFNQESVDAPSSIPYEPLGSEAANAQQSPPTTQQTLPPVTHSNVLPGSIPQPNYPGVPVTSDTQQLVANPSNLQYSTANPQHSPISPVAPTSNNTPLNVTAAPPVFTPPQGSQPASPMVETNPLLSGPSHPSAFHKVKGHLTQKPVPLTASVNPSPPLWSTEVPPLPSNILLAPAAPSGNAPQLVAPSPQPIKVDSKLAASIANVSVPPPPTYLGQPPAATTTMPPTSAGQNAPNVEQVTRHLAGLTVAGSSPQPVLLPPVNPTMQSMATTAPPVQPVVPKPVQSLPSLSQAGFGQIAVTASPSAPTISAHHQQGSPVKVVQPPVTVLATDQQMPVSSQTVTGPPTSVAAPQIAGQYPQHQQQPYGPNQQQVR